MTITEATQKTRVGIIFAGGPAPAANSVIGACAAAFLENGHEVLGFFHGYSNLQDYHPVSHRLLPDKHYRVFSERDLRGLRNSRGIIIGTARANPGKPVQKPEDLKDPKKTEKLKNVYSALLDLQIDALISIGGDDTLRTANLMVMYQRTLPPDHPHVRVIHLPKTIDNDYEGIDFTFGFFTAVDIMAKEVLNLRADALATSSYYIIETMGRKAGWLAYGTAIAGEANLVISVEDAKQEDLTHNGSLSLEKLADYVVDLIRTREVKTDKHYGTVVLAEGLAEHLPEDALKTVSRDEHGHVSLGKIDLGKMVASKVAERYEERYGRAKKCVGVQLGYESRCGAPHAFDVMLGSQLGVGGYKAVIDQGLDAHMVSTSGQLDITFVPFEKIIDQKTLKATARFIKPGSDFHQLARFLETRVEHDVIDLGSRKELSSDEKKKQKAHSAVNGQGGVAHAN
uniref:Phosphofructokinase domain-containing protein n=1 Tax=Chromera velia CCMP2878 TaxID=1169474 RepID=A0A0G4HNI1_9ALVE|mmetsp:Transcript_36309/g.71432  ORF Transcript_36309/g.71432 Transcript_36309/m.71432 type:complete len:455 (-) Transcript_36309:154-1518(-)|eukprot:Cvel_7608.t1-p1 / transcript=Cvel_7608.t1 / gene=Cvel_7608 / organism=Chromera_velia_CCMP2878 / gene_product=Pyrophosphate--fructose 6-phosphate, putative / transcript_product=Pyrophosphate--fructose 6-phosphate, putative / location=Cvel_scaffold401:35193-43627(-) / protein_length=454 / sequence_SO=supercontig / SO=protein_coding / is_pseudo=false